MTILLTGFNPFGGSERNVSEELVRAIEASWQRTDLNLVVEVLPTEFERAGRLIVNLISTHRPELVVSCGLADHEPCIRFERVARNLDSCNAADNADVCRPGSVIDSDGPEAYEATIPYSSLGRELSLRGIPYRYSFDAGGFVCNHVFYQASHFIRRQRLPTRIGFIHWPASPDAHSAQGGLHFDVSLQALRLCLDCLLQPPERSANGSSPGAGDDAFLPPWWVVERVRDTATLQSVIDLDRASFSMPWSPEMFEFAAGAQDFCLLTLRAPEKTEIAGFICYCVAKELEISTLAVRRDLRRRGLATLLVRRALSDGQPRVPPPRI